MKIVFTGVQDEVRTNETKIFERFGIQVQKGITKSTDVLIKGYNPGQGKLNKAEQYGIKIMSKDAFFDWLRDNNPEFFL